LIGYLTDAKIFIVFEINIGKVLIIF
jgi:hypothetical protein